MNATAEALTTRRQSPLAFGDDVKRFAALTVMLAVTDFKLRFFGSALGYLWSLMRPLMLFGVLYVVFTQVIRLGEGVQYYAVYLLMSIVLFTYFSETTARGLGCLLERENLLRKMRFPRLAIPLSVSLAAMFNLCLNLVVVFAFALAAGVQPRLSWLQLPLLVLALAALGTGLAMTLSVLYVRFRDIQPIWDVLLQILFYASPILYVVGKLPDSVAREALANPLAAIMTQARHAVLDPAAPSAAEAIGAGWRLVIPLGVALLAVAFGLWLFRRETPRIAENL
ncbi:MAG: ABC transporter permease [Thermoleophilaceae bacterium]